jgi:hypothetical protein
MKKRLRLLLWAAGVGLLLLLALGAVALTSSFQTWAARRALAARPEVRATLGSVSAGLGRTAIRDLRVEFRGVAVTLPIVELEVPLVRAGWHRTAIASRVVAHGWTMEFAPALGAPAAALAAGVRRVSAEAAVQAFVGVFAQLALPLDIAIDGVDLQGEIVLPESRGRVKIAIKGGGLAAGRDAKFDVTAGAALTGDEVKSVEVRGELAAKMDSPRTFTALAVRLDATAIGPEFPGGVRLHAEADARRGGAGETYAVRAVTEGREILAVSAQFPVGAPRIEGRWSVQARDADLAPFALGKALPAFSLAGEGSFDADAGFRAFHLAGRLDATASRLEILRKELAALGPLTLGAEFDLAQRDGAIAARRLEATLSATAGPVATMRLLQEFEINPGTRELRTAQVAQELFALTLHGAPLAWAKPWLDGLDPGAARVRGEIVAAPRNGGVALRSRAPLAIDGFALARGGQPLVAGVDLLVSLAADYTPQGWQAEIPGLAAKAGGETLFTFEARAGRLVGRDEPIKATGRLIAQLPLVLAQPLAANRLALAAGELEVNFAASLAARHEVQAAIAVRNLAVPAAEKPAPLPALALDLRLDAAPGGTVVFAAPILIEHEGRKSDLALTGTLAPAGQLPPALEALATGNLFHIADAQAFAAALVPPAAAPAVPAPPAAPPWAGLNGAISLRLKEVVFTEALRATNVTGRLRLDAGMVKLEGLQAGLGEAGRAQAEGRVTFDASAPQPYALAAELSLRDVDSGPLLRALDGARAAPVEGRFDAAGTFAARAAAPAGLAAAATGEFSLTSRGGVFRGLPVAVTIAAESAGRIATLLASIGGKREAEIAGKAEAVAEFARALNPVAYDQLSLRVARDAARHLALEDFTLIAPELRLSGAGRTTPRPGAGPLEAALEMEFRLRARGRQGDLLRYLGLLEPTPDSLGYTACALPLRVTGTLGQPETPALNARLAALALEKSGVTEKASELFNRLIGGGK